MRATIALLLSAAVLAGCGKSEESGSGGSSGSGGGAGTASGNAPGLDGSKDLSADLKKVMESAFAAAKSGDKAKLAEQVKTFPLPKPEEFFKKVFGDAGAERTAEYSKLLPSFEKEIGELFEKVAGENYGVVEVYYLTNPDDPKAKGNQKEAMKSMKSPVPIYTVHFRPKPGEAGHSIYNWVYLDNGFRLMGR